MAKHDARDGTICQNRRARQRFEVLEKLECGIALQGTEVRSLREKDMSLDEAYVRVEGGELWLIGCRIATYRFGAGRNHDPTRRRKLLAHRRQVQHLQVQTEQAGFTLIPLRLYFNDRGIAKVTVGVVRGLKRADKRDVLKAREHQREMDQAMRRRR